MDYTQLIKFFLSTSVITAGIIYLVKVIVDKFFESRIENYKNSLQKDSDQFRHNLNFETERFRHVLNTASIEHQVKYSKLYEERGQIIKETYNLLFELENSLSALTTLFQGHDWMTDTERDKKVRNDIQILRTQLEKNRIFFTEELCIKIESILSDAFKITVEMFKAKSYALSNEDNNRRGIVLSEKDLLKPSEIWHELDEKVQREINAARLELAQEFRVLIGVI